MFFSENKRSDENVLIGVIIIIVIIPIIAYKWFTRKRDEELEDNFHAQSGSTAGRKGIIMASLCNFEIVRQRSRNN